MCMVKSVLNLCIYFTGTHALLQEENGLWNCHQTTSPVRYNYKERKKSSSYKIQSGKNISDHFLPHCFFCVKKNLNTASHPQKIWKSFKNTFQHKIWIQLEDLDGKKWVTSETEEIYLLPECYFLLCWPFWNETSCMVTSLGEYFLFWSPFWNDTFWFDE